jgi:ATP-binding cassette subfamily B protein/subfamily B ATP-binding cassette protein MsbA
VSDINGSGAEDGGTRHLKPRALPDEASVRFRHSSRQRYRAYRKTAKSLDEASREKGITDEELKEKIDDARRQGGRRGVIVSRRRSGKRNRGFFQLFAKFWEMLAGQRGRLIASLLVGALATVFGLLSPLGMQIVIDGVLNEEPLTGVLKYAPLPTEPMDLLWTTFWILLSIAVVNLGLNLWSRWQATKVAKRTVVHSRRVAFEHAVRLPLHRVYDIKSGGVASILRDDAGGVGELTFTMIYNPWKAIVQIVGTLIALALLEWRLLLVFAVVVPVVWITHKTWISRIRPLWRDVRTTRQYVDGHATESFGGMRVVRTFNRSRAETSQFVANNHLMARQELFTWWWMRGIDSAWSIIIPGAVATLLLVGGLLGVRGQMTGGELAAYVGFLFALLQPIATLANSATSFQNHLAGLDRTLDLLGEDPEFERRDTTQPLEREAVQGRVTLEDLEYAYPLQTGDLGEGAAELGEPVLQGVSLDVEPGTTVAFVGPSGAGKTTLCNLIARFYDPTGGSIKLDGRDLRDIDIDDYRGLLGIVEQDTFLFDGTIAENIAYGRRDATRDDVEQAARLANAHEFIDKLEDSYDSLIGERGVKLSGGQRQRLTIARAILADPKILILDEATSNLDTESERLIQGSLSKLMRGRTSFVIAHRLSTIQAADVIAVIDDGRLIETGTHEELMDQSGKYRQMVELQTDRSATLDFDEQYAAV